MWYAYLGKLFAKIGKEIVVFGGAIAAFALLILGHKRSVKKAKNEGIDEGKKTQQAEIELETKTRALKIKDKAHEIKTEIERDTHDIDSLRKRMRDASNK